MWQNKKQALYKPLLLALALMLIALPVSGCGGESKEADEPQAGKDESKVVAEYQGGQVTEREFAVFLGAHKFFNFNEMYPYYETMPDFKPSMLNQYIATLVLTKDAADDVNKDSQERAGKDMEAIESEFNNNVEVKKQIEQFLEDENINLNDLNNYIVLRYNMQNILDNKFTDEQVRQKYDDHVKADPNTYAKATVRHVLVALKDQQGNDIRTEEEALKRAQEAYQKLKSTGDWDTLAKEYSDDGNKDAGGQYKDVEVSQWVEEFRNAALTQPLNEIGEPFPTQFGYHVLVVEARGFKTYDEVKPDVENRMIGEFFNNFIEKEIPEMIIRVDLPEPEQPPVGETGQPEETGDTGKTAE